MVLNSQFLVKDLNSCDVNCGPLSVIKISGIPYWAKCCLSILIVDFVVVSVIASTSQKLL